MTTAECVVVLKGAGKRLPNAIRRGMRRGMVQIGVEAQRIAAQRGIMRTLLGHGGHGPVDGTKWKSPGKGLIRVKSPKILGDGSVVSGLEAVGLAALQELGGRTRPHIIQAKKGGVLTLKGFVHPFATKVKHPGSTIQAHPFMQQAIQNGSANLMREIEKALAEEVVKFEKAAA